MKKGFCLLESLSRLLYVFWREVNPEKSPFEGGRNDNGGSAAAEGVEHELAGMAGSEDDAFEEFFGHLAAMKPGSFFKGSADS